MSKANNLGDFLLDIANAIRDREGITGKINPQDFARLIRGVPEEYTRLNYIESTGTQYIDTGFAPTVNTKIIYDVKLTSTDAGRWSGCYVNEGSWLLLGSGGNGFDVYLGSQYNTKISEKTNRKTVTFDIPNKSVFVDGENVLTVNSYTADNCTLPLFNTKRSTGFENYAYMRLYSCKIYDNGILVRNFIPALRSDGIAGLYDSVNDTFYTSNSTDNFVAGNIE